LPRAFFVAAYAAVMLTLGGPRLRAFQNNWRDITIWNGIFQKYIQNCSEWQKGFLIISSLDNKAKIRTWHQASKWLAFSLTWRFCF